MFGYQPVKQVHELVGSTGGLHVDGEALAGEDALDVEQLLLTTVAGFVEPEVRRPDGVGMKWGSSPPQAHRESSQGLLAPAKGDLEALQAP